MQSEQPPTSPPDNSLLTIVHVLSGVHNDTSSLARPELKASLASAAPLYITMYAVLVICGASANIAVLITVARGWMRGGAGRDTTCGYVANLALADLIKCLLVLPVSLVLLLVRNWVFGSFLCYFAPMLQDVPVHVSTLTFLLIAFDRYRFVQNPGKPRLPGFVCAVGTWLLAVCIVLPYPIYITYIDLEKFLKGTLGDQVKGVGICVVNLIDDMQEYMRGLFIIMYIFPLGLISYLYVRMSKYIRSQEGPLAVIMYESRARGGCRGGSAASSAASILATRIVNECRPPGRFSGYDVYYEAELDVEKEKRTHQYLMAMVTVFAICLCPLMVLRVVKMQLIETYENSVHFDIAYVFIVWLAFVPTCTTPVLFVAWRTNRPTLERLRGYLRFSHHRESSPEREQEQNGNGTTEGTVVVDMDDGQDRESDCRRPS